MAAFLGTVPRPEALPVRDWWRDGQDRCAPNCWKGPDSTVQGFPPSCQDTCPLRSPSVTHVWDSSHVKSHREVKLSRGNLLSRDRIGGKTPSSVFHLSYCWRWGCLGVKASPLRPPPSGMQLAPQTPPEGRAVSGPHNQELGVPFSAACPCRRDVPRRRHCLWSESGLPRPSGFVTCQKGARAGPVWVGPAPAGARCRPTGCGSFPGSEFGRHALCASAPGLRFPGGSAARPPAPAKHTQTQGRLQSGPPAEAPPLGLPSWLALLCC